VKLNGLFEYMLKNKSIRLFKLMNIFMRVWNAVVKNNYNKKDILNKNNKQSNKQ
jgi:hypothetical protein